MQNTRSLASQKKQRPLATSGTIEERLYVRFADSIHIGSVCGEDPYEHLPAHIRRTLPAADETILYRLVVRSRSMIHVEHIKAATARIKNGWHEQIADHLTESLGGDQKITAVHQGVEIETVRLSR